MRPALLRRVIMGLIDLVVVAPVRRVKLLRRGLAYVESRLRVPDPPHALLRGHASYCWLPGHDVQYNARYYAAMRTLFLGDDRMPRIDRERRATIVERFERIDADVDIKTSPVEGLLLAEAVLSLQNPGDLVECGCYAGGSTAKLSVLAGLTGRRLFAFDSFEGLPAPMPNEVRDLHLRRGENAPHDWAVGEYCGPLETVRATVEAFGDLASCTFVKGWFRDTLEASLPDCVAFAFVDVDLASSAVECLRHLWPRMPERGVLFSHDIAYLKVLEALTDPHFWQDLLYEPPPIFFGAGFGLGDAAAHLGFAVKGRFDPEYIKSLTLNK